MIPAQCRIFNEWRALQKLATDGSLNSSQLEVCSDTTSFASTILREV